MSTSPLTATSIESPSGISSQNNPDVLKLPIAGSVCILDPPRLGWPAIPSWRYRSPRASVPAPQMFCLFKIAHDGSCPPPRPTADSCGPRTRADGRADVQRNNVCEQAALRRLARGRTRISLVTSRFRETTAIRCLLQGARCTDAYFRNGFKAMGMGRTLHKVCCMSPMLRRRFAWGGSPGTKRPSTFQTYQRPRKTRSRKT
jgi:hypothetical protein